MNTKSKNIWQLFVLSLIVAVAIILAPKANAATHTISKVTGTISLPIYLSGDTLEITGAALDTNDWTELRNNTTLDFHLYLNNPAMTTIDTDPAAVSIMQGNTRILSLKAPHILSIADGGLVGFFYFGAFYGCTNLESVDMPNATFIGQSAFDVCRALKSVSLPAATSIGVRAFVNCRALKSVSLPAATSIGEWAFLNCVALESVSLPAATTIGNGAFFDCTALESVSLPAATTIGDNAFYDCTALESVSLPAATSIELQAFYNCTSLKSVSLPAATTIGNNAFQDCHALESISLPAATSIGDWAFLNCTALKNISLPVATTIGEEAFLNCIALTEYVFGANPPTILGASIGLGSYAAPAYCHDRNTYAWENPQFTLDAVNHARATLVDYSLTTYSLTAITPATAYVALGASQSFATTLSSSTAPPTSPTIYQNWITWQLTGTNTVLSTIDALGKVTIDPAETNTTLIVLAKSVIGTKTVEQRATITIGTAPAITPPTTTTTTPANYVYNFAQLPTVENNYTAIVNVDFAKFSGVYVDGSLLSSDKYTAQSGSTIVRLNESFINTLSTGEHTIGLSFSDGLASGTFNVAGANSGILGIGVYPFEGGMQPYTPSVTPSIRAIEEEKLDEGVFEQEIFD